MGAEQSGQNARRRQSRDSRSSASSSTAGRTDTMSSSSPSPAHDEDTSQASPGTRAVLLEATNETAPAPFERSSTSESPAGRVERAPTSSTALQERGMSARTRGPLRSRSGLFDSATTSGDAQVSDDRRTLWTDGGGR